MPYPNCQQRRWFSHMDALVKADGDPPSPREQLLQHYYLQQDEETHLRDYWRIIRKHRWIVLTFFAMIVTTATIYTFSLTPTYRATSSLKIDYERPQILSFQEIGSPGHQNYGPEFMGTQQKLLQSRSLAKRVIETLKAGGQRIALDRTSAARRRRGRAAPPRRPVARC